ncbi:MAG: hypothetical protein V3U03_10445 [Myxococcota bacterium]
MVKRDVPGPYRPEEMERFLETFMYQRPGFFVDEVTRFDAEQHEIEARLRTTGPLPLSDLQRTRAGHPPHVAAGELLMATGSLGCMHAWFFHGCRWDEGWAGFGNRIHRADFKRLVRRGPDLRLTSRETRTRVGPTRVVLRFEFRFWQDGQLAYFGDQSAMFVKDRDFAESPG